TTQQNDGKRVQAQKYVVILLASLFLDFVKYFVKYTELEEVEQKSGFSQNGDQAYSAAGAHPSNNFSHPPPPFPQYHQLPHRDVSAQFQAYRHGGYGSSPNRRAVGQKEGNRQVFGRCAPASCKQDVGHQLL
ncbi:MAG: hypothetical protein P8X78_02260, partial [Nitrosopumilaceae archaeon]